MTLSQKAQAILYRDKAIREAQSSLDKGLITDTQYAELKLSIEKAYRSLLKGEKP